MALFRRIKSPRERHVTQNTSEGEKVKESEKSPSGHRRHKSDEHIVVAVEPSIFEEPEPPELPPRYRSSAGGSFSFGVGYRRTQSSGTMSVNFKTPGHAPGKSQDDYFVPADTLRNLSVGATPEQTSYISKPTHLPDPQTLQDQRIMTMHQKIMSHNAPGFRESQKQRRCKSFDKLVDNSDYSVPFDVLQELEREESGHVPPPKPPTKRASHGRGKIPDSGFSSGELLRSNTQPPNYEPPPPPEDDKEELELDRQTDSVSPHSPTHSHSPRAGDYDDPWDSSKFQLHGKGVRKGSRHRADTEPPKVLALSPHFDPYKSTHTRAHPTNHVHHDPSPEPEPPLPPKHIDSIPDLKDPRISPSPPPPPLPESTRPRASTGESDYCEPPDSTSYRQEGQESLHGYVNQPPLHDKNGGRSNGMNNYVNQPDFPPQLPPRSSFIINHKKKHSYPPLVPPDISNPPDIHQPLPPPAFPIEASMRLEEQP